MARPPKTGLNYFPLYVDFFDDPKIAAVTVEHGTKGQAAAIMLLCHIYRNGYYIEWTPENSVTVIKELPGITFKNMEQIVRTLVEWGFFDRKLFEQHQVLTSREIQEHYMVAARRRKNAPSSTMPYWLEKQDTQAASAHKPTQPLSQPAAKPTGSRKDVHQESTEGERRVSQSKSEKRITNADSQGRWIANPTEQTPEQPTEQPNDQTTNLPISQTTNLPISQTTNLPISQTTKRPISQTTKRPISQTTKRPISQTTKQPIPQTTEYTKDETGNTAVLLQSEKPLMSAEIPQEDNKEINNNINPSPSSARAREIETKEAVRQLMENDGWMMVMCRKHNLDKRQLNQYIREFASDCECRGKHTHESISDTQSHFCNWLLIRQKQASLQKQATMTTPRIYGYQYQRRTSADYIAEAQQQAIEATERFIREAEIKRGGIPPHLPF